MVCLNMQTIEIDKIDAGDKRFCISYPLEDDLLLSSIARFGLLVPVTLLAADRPAVVLGFKRLAAAEKLGIKGIPCLYLGGDEKRALLAAISDNMGRSLNAVEKMRCVERMSALGFGKEEIFEILKIIGLPAREQTLETVLAAADLEEETKAFVVRHGLPFTAIEQLVWLDHGERRRIVEIIDPLDVTVSSFREAMQLMMLLKVKHGRIDVEGFAGADSMGSVKRGLKQMAHPLLSEMERALARLLKSCALPPNIRLHVDPFFEKDWIDISLRVRSGDEVDYASKKLERLLAEGLFGSLFELTHGSPIRN